MPFIFFRFWASFLLTKEILLHKNFNLLSEFCRADISYLRKIFLIKLLLINLLKKERFFVSYPKDIWWLFFLMCLTFFLQKKRRYSFGRPIKFSARIFFFCLFRILRRETDGRRERSRDFLDLSVTFPKRHHKNHRQHGVLFFVERTVLCARRTRFKIAF